MSFDLAREACIIMMLDCPSSRCFWLAQVGAKGATTLKGDCCSSGCSVWLRHPNGFQDRAQGVRFVFPCRSLPRFGRPRRISPGALPKEKKPAINSKEKVGPSLEKLAPSATHFFLQENIGPLKHMRSGMQPVLTFYSRRWYTKVVKSVIRFGSRNLGQHASKNQT